MSPSDAGQSARAVRSLHRATTRSAERASSASTHPWKMRVAGRKRPSTAHDRGPHNDECHIRTSEPRTRRRTFATIEHMASNLLRRGKASTAYDPVATSRPGMRTSSSHSSPPEAVQSIALLYRFNMQHSSLMLSILSHIMLLACFLYILK